jgi:hypothetical protein
LIFDPYTQARNRFSIQCPSGSCATSPVRPLFFSSARHLSTQTQTLKGRVRLAATLIGHHYQFKYRDIGERYRVIFDFADGFGWAEIPLLAHDLSVFQRWLSLESSTLVFSLSGFHRRKVGQDSDPLWTRPASAQRSAQTDDCGSQLLLRHE